MSLRFLSLSLVTLACVALAPQLFGQAAGNDNPGGVTADYRGSSTLAGNYDPYTGNAKREIDDVVVTGSIGAYPLKFTRILNTRGVGWGNSFGRGGGWTHSFAWSLWIRPPGEWNGNDESGYYDGPVRTIDYPGGGHYDTLTYDDGWPISATAHGPDDRLFNAANGSYELRRADGGKVLFEHVNGYRAYAIIDPFGQQTTLTYDASARLWKVTEPGGRYLEFFYQTFSYWMASPSPGRWVNEDVISIIQANDGRGNVMESVSYGYDWVWLGVYFPARCYRLRTVSFDDGAQGAYTYQDANSSDMPGINQGHTAPIVSSCEDPRYAGPMKYIQYEYVPWTEVADAGRGQIKAEKNVAGQVVARTSYPKYPAPANDPFFLRRTETRGDGQSRSFNYPWSSNSFTWTDFKNQLYTEADFANPNSYGWTITGPLGHTTTYEQENILGALKKITFPATSDNGFTTREYTFSDPSNPYFHSGEKDENGYWTYFQRDGNNRVTLITHPDQSTEEFTYNNLGQVLTHKLRSGGTENFRYDTRGRKIEYWPPPTPSDPDPAQHKTRYSYYESGPNTDRLYMVIDPRNNATAYEYNLRGQVTKVQHQDGTYAQSAYNLEGTLAWTADENHPGAATDPNQRARYTYDEYKRVLTVTNPMGETTTSYYGLDWANPLLHTTNSVKYTLSSMNKNVVFDYDANFRKIDQVAASGTADEAWTLFEYDEVGNLKKTTDPRSKVTTFGYDQRNRKIWMDSPIALDRNSLGHTMNWVYDGVGNKLKETRADDAFRSWEYDTPNRITRAIDWRMSTSELAITTTYERNVTSTVETTKDAKNAVYTFTFDGLHRKIGETYPPAFGNSSPNVTFSYDAVGNLILYKNPAGQYKHLDYADSYDSRNRLRHAGWNLSASTSAADWSVGQEVRTEYDAASRMTSISTNNGQTTVAFGYDAANRQVSEDQTLAGYPIRHVETLRDADGNRSDLFVPGYYLLYYDYTARNQLAHIKDGNNNPAWTYTYDKAGNVTNRFGQWGLSNGVNYGYDALNRIEQVEQGNAAIVFSRSHYLYDKVNREVATWRDGPQDEAGSKGERFWYTTNNQVKDAWYKASNVWTATPSNPATYRGYTYTSDMLNWSSVNDNGFNAPFVANALNQYTSINGSTPHYDDRFNLDQFSGMQYPHDSANQLTSVTGNGHSASFAYDGLGRCVRRTVDGVTRVFVYDGWNPICEWDQAGNWKALNLYGPGADEILGRYDAVLGSLIYKQDKQGNVMFVLNPSNQIVEKYTYDVYGTPKIFSSNNTERSASAIGNRFMYTGREWIGELGLYDYRHRFYFPGIGRFLETDPMGLQTEGAKLSAGQKALFSPGGSAPEAFSSSEMNLFRYCGDDPVNMTDPSGLEPMGVDPETDALAHQGLNLNMAAMQNTMRFGVLFRYEFATTVLQSAQGKILSETRTDRELQQVAPPSRDGMTSLVETHNHTLIPRNGDPFTHVNLSRKDIMRGDRFGRPQYVIAPDGVRERYRPSDKPTEAERKKEGGIIERWNDGWKRDPKANTDMTKMGGNRNGY